MTRADNVLNMQITIVNCMKQEWNIDFCEISDMLEKLPALLSPLEEQKEIAAILMKNVLKLTN